MDEDDLTPTKTISRVNIPPKTKETVCILFVETGSNPNYHCKLFFWLQQVTSARQFRDSSWCEARQGHSVTEIICRKCARTNENVVKKILEIRQQLLSSKERLAAHRGTVDSVERQ